MLTEEQKAFAEFLQTNHCGQDNAVTTKNIRQWGKGPKIRDMVHALRLAGIPICSGQRGYYYASSQRELDSTLNFLMHHIAEVQKAYAGLRLGRERLPE